MKSLLKSLFVLLLITQTFSAKASHALGGEIYWECDPANTGKYIFYLQVLRDCGGTVTGCYQNGPTTIDGPFGAIQMPNKLIHAQDISPDCRNSTISCNATTQTGKGAVELHLWKSNPITLNGIPPANTGWSFTWTCNARPGTLVNGGANQTYVLRAKMYPFTPVGKNPPVANNTNPCFDSSPRFLESPAITICEGPFTYNHLAADKDLDSLYFKWADPWSAVGQSINWNTGFSSTSPFPSPQSNPANGPLVLDGRTGEVSMNIQSANTGSYASCFAVEAWRCGQIAPGVVGPVLIAEVYRDIAIILRNDCDPVFGGAPNNPPQFNVDTQVYKNIKKVGNSYTTKVYPGDTVRFQFSAADQDFYLGQFQNITFTAAGLQVSKPLASGTGCIGPAPCAKFTPVPPQVGYVKTLKNEQEFFWVPDCQHLGVAGNFCNPINKFSFSLRMQDDGCPAPEISLVTFTVEVVPGDPTPPPLKCLSYIDPSGDIRVAWDSIPLDSGLNFNYYKIMGSNNINGPYDTLYYITDRDSLSVIVNGGLGYEHFYIQQSTGKCDFLSTASDTLSLMRLNLTATPPGSAEYASLVWTPLHKPLAPSTKGYEIWSEAPLGSGNWKFVDRTDTLTYTDTVSVCNALVNYQIRVTDTITGCQSMSTLDSARFSDKTNKDKMVLDSVSVNAAGNAIISWDTTKYADVVNYYLYFNDPKLGWIVVDTIPVGTAMPHEWAGSKADTRSEQFKVTSVDSCGNQSDDQIVKPHATIFLRNYLNKCEAYSRISWNTYEGFGKDAVVGYKLLLQTNSGPWVELFTAGPQDTSYLQRNLDNGSTYCYRVQAVDTTGRTSTSNELCIDAEVPRKSKVLYLAQVTNDLDRDAVKIHAFIDSKADVLEFNLERAPSELGPFRTIGTIEKPGAGITTISFNDYDADSDKRHYYYRMSATDSCGGRDTVSNLSRNILMHATPRPNLTNLITWNPYSTWGGVVDRYEIYRKGENDGMFKLAGTTAGNDTTFVDDISDYRETFGSFCYYVQAIESGNPLGYAQDNGQPFFSRSNNRCINQGAKVFMATAFRPGSDVLQNQTYGPSMRFNEVSEYHFYIMNRWGVKVFETFDPSVKWDGTYNGADAQQGVYIYFLKYSTLGGVPDEGRGDFTLIR